MEERKDIENLLDPRHLNHPFKVRGEDSVLDEPAGELAPLIGLAAIDGQTRFSVLVLSILQVTGYFLVYTKVQSGLDHIRFEAYYIIYLSI